MSIVGARQRDMRLQRRYLDARIKSLDAFASLRAAAWDWLELQEEGGGGIMEDEAADLVLEAVEEVEAVAREVRELGRWRLRTDVTSRLYLAELARNLELCAQAALVLLLSHSPHVLFADDTDLTMSHGPAHQHHVTNPPGHPHSQSLGGAALVSRTLRKRLECLPLAPS